MALIEHQSGDPAPNSGEYEELNVSGGPDPRLSGAGNQLGVMASVMGRRREGR
jgi:hypothetical protein